MGVASRIIFIVLPILFLLVVVVIFFGQEGAWEDLKDSILGLKEGTKGLLPEVKVGLDELEADISIPAQHRTEILQLEKTIQRMLGDKKDCFANYGGLSDLGEKGTVLVFELKGSKTVLTVQGTGGKQTITDLRADIPGMKPCVIAGEGGISKKFYQHFINGQGLTYPYYQPVNSVAITYDNNNVVRVKDFGSEPVNDRNDNLEDNGWLFTPDGEHICFFPTNKWSNYDDDGIANEWFTTDESNSILNRVNKGELTSC